MEIAIIGAGVSGLTTAYYLSNEQAKRMGINVTVYEKEDTVGGNAHTLNVFLRDSTRRFADMGVNDFNKKTYSNLVELWNDLKIMNNDYCLPLVNTESFSEGGTSKYVYWVDGEGNVKADEKFVPRKIIQDNLKKFKEELVKWFEQSGDKVDYTITVGKWAADVAKLPIEFIEGNLYPRVNAMYYTQEKYGPIYPPPGNMPLWMVAHYYILQEGYALKPGQNVETRQFFVGGSTKWLKHLEGVLTFEQGVSIQKSKPDLYVARDTVKPPYKLNVVNGSAGKEFDVVIFATHADDTIKIMHPSARDTDEMMNALGQFTYGTSTVYAHQDPSYVPSDVEYKRTYNIHKHDYKVGSDWKYGITYIENYHQGEYPSPENKLYYVTVNPFDKKIPKDILWRQDIEKRAEATFRHCQLDVKAINAQITIDKVQLHSSPELREHYYAGSYTIGAGLHEECIIQAKEIANKIMNPKFVSANRYDFSGKREHFAPKYIMDAITLNKK